jgi:CBS domain containing-hemolysin-like protein
MLGDEIGHLIIVAVCLLMSAFFSSSEAALLSMLRTARMAHLASTGSQNATRVARMLEDPGRLLSTILLGNNIVNVAFASVVTVITLSLIEDEGIAALAATAIGAAVLLIFGEIIPKSFAVQHPVQVAFINARPLAWIELALWPLITLVNWFGRIASFGGQHVKDQPSITEEELRTMIDIGDAEGAIKPEEAEMLESVFRFGDRQVRDMMTPRTEIISLQRGTSMEKFLGIYAENVHTRFPIYKESPDNIVGILSAKDILKAMAAQEIGPSSPITDVIRDAYFIPETKRIAELFDELRGSGNQMAIAIDEYGGIAGLVTLKRLLEEVVGRVGEEGVSPAEEYEALGKDTFQVDGGMSIDEIKEELDIDLGEGEFETVAGFVLEALGHIPVEGESFDTRGLAFEITKMADLKIDGVKITKKPGQGN